MKKYILSILILTCNLFSQNISIDFIESKHIEALDEKVSKKGRITFFENEAIIHYFEPNEKTIFFDSESIKIQTSKGIVVKTKREEPAIAMMFIMFKALYENDEQTIRKYFNISKNYKDEIVLTTKSHSSPISKIIYEVKNEKVSKLYITGRDNSRITIEVDSKK